MVAEEAKLLFGMAPRRSEFAVELPQIFTALKQALDWLGAGAKTAVGYGRMVEDAARLTSLSEEAAKATARAELARLPPEQQALRALRERFEADQQRGAKAAAGGEAIDRLNQLLKEGLNWPVPARMELAALAETIYGYVGWGAKKSERRQKIAALRG